MRYIFIGDIHGCIEELDLLIDKIKLRSDDRLVFLGDLVDRGPDSIRVIRRVKELLDLYPGSICVAGNHESSKIGQLRKGVFKDDWCEFASESDWEFLKSLPLLKQLVIGEHKVLAVHAGLYPKFFEYYEEGLSRIREDWHRGGGKYMSRARRFLYLRYITPEGRALSLGENKEGDFFWAEKYDGHQGYIFYGHEPYLRPAQPRLDPYACGLDTGCVFGGSLTAAIVEKDPREAVFVSVPALREYVKPKYEFLR